MGSRRPLGLKGGSHSSPRDALLSPFITRRVIEQFTHIPLPTLPRELDDLTARERDILGLIAHGLSNAEIGQRLYISETTVKTHVTHVLQKLNLRDRVQAVVLAYHYGLVEHSPILSGQA